MLRSPERASIFGETFGTDYWLWGVSIIDPISVHHLRQHHWAPNNTGLVLTLSGNFNTNERIHPAALYWFHSWFMVALRRNSSHLLSSVQKKEAFNDSLKDYAAMKQSTELSQWSTFQSADLKESRFQLADTNQIKFSIYLNLLKGRKVFNRNFKNAWGRTSGFAFHFSVLQHWISLLCYL